MVAAVHQVGSTTTRRAPRTKVLMAGTLSLSPRRCQMTGQETGFQVSPEIREILVRSFVESFHVVFPSSPNHHQHHNKAAAGTPSTELTARPHVDGGAEPRR